MFYCSKTHSPRHIERSETDFVEDAVKFLDGAKTLVVDLVNFSLSTHNLQVVCEDKCAFFALLSKLTA